MIPLVPLTQFSRIEITGGCVLVDQSRVREPIAQLFDRDSYANERVRDGRGGAYRVRGSFGEAALRHYCRGGLLGSLLQDRYCFLGEARTRSVAELQLLHSLHAAGLPVPRPLACGFSRSGPIYRADLLTQWLPGAQPWSARVRQSNTAEFAAIGVMIRRFHDAGLWHADLNAHNVLWTQDGPALIDFDRCALRAPALSWHQSNLRRLQRSLIKLGFGALPGFAENHWAALIAAYHSGSV